MGKNGSNFIRKLFQPNSFGGKVLLRVELQTDDKFNFENFESALYVESVSMPLIQV